MVFCTHFLSSLGSTLFNFSYWQFFDRTIFLSQKKFASSFQKPASLIEEQKVKKKFQTILGIIFWNFEIVQYRSYLEQVKQNLISSIRVAPRVARPLKTLILGHQNISKQCEIWVKTHSSAQSSSQKLVMSNSSQKVGKSNCKIFVVISTFIEFLYFVPNILSGIVLALYPPNFNFLTFASTSKLFSKR